ncbi:MAG: 2-polyprenyl-3-methyl-6-methoxy-1,4-benzoquinone monooxygenase [Gammaproteobacteria bacterium]|nr:2-polyprenyl-3-methyl-6-methoxy-1,4-benzoquinone monooxygenase [Gammaproteobacteria bacterium]MCW8839658.1 2-polyprenyl-3-methyl-6-methoxy-1,4-benzoquinone monooxygenase [Gammaproteobacteria bacterium]MCW8958125.1 2-polyprenyl-3-methyl-6-methoxy-1,4-benzoquinone monooxygenase [Gammaproteobacteria bacterium]MCW8973694.1 2-polyprenyl-3-methyl-6-methoxy-1,4-benzoquinone monooxygenase [Gammaproteobacteria bacterium]MCW8993558.1 2-polyprenyl-3-methyl-6-methoxy-1,4-benzoquinone monooxygenase [Gamm
MRNYSPLDRLFINLDTALRTVAGQPKITERPNPAEGMAEAPLSDSERDLSGRLMRINHAGEVSAQGLYQGQALAARLPEVREKMERAALEENDHLAWCEHRAKELGTHISYLNPLWYGGSVAIGALAGAIGDRWSLGFVVETEQQVCRHLEEHLARLSPEDKKTRALLKQMHEDEARHADLARAAGGAPLPAPLKTLMQLVSKVMTRTTYWV